MREGVAKMAKSKKLSVCVRERWRKRERAKVCVSERESRMVFPQFEKFAYFVRVCADRTLPENGNSCFFVNLS